MKISIVSTLYKSEPFLKRFLEEIKNSLKEIGCTDYEVIFVNDGSPDNSQSLLLNLQKNISEIKIVELSRNFGHHYAIQAGLQKAKGDYIFLVDNDLETPPSVIVEFYKEMINNTSLDVVFGYQEIRKGRFVEKFAGKLFWYLLNKMSDVKIPHNILTERLMTRTYVNALLSLQDANLFMGGMMHWVGFNQKGIPIKKGVREGKSTYSFKKRAELMLQAITSFSGKPLVWLFYFGVTVSAMSTLFVVYLLIEKLVLGNAIQMGWTSIIAINLLVLGIISTFLGIIGIYLFKIFKQVQGRPNVIIRKIYE